LAIMLAIPPSLFGAYFSSCRLLALFNIDCGGFAVSPRGIGFMILGGLLAPLLAALPAILRGATMNVRMAMASYGLATDFGYNLFDRGLEKLAARFLPTLYAAALGNLFRRKARWLLTQSVLIIAGILFLVLMSLIASVNLTLDNETARSRYALRVGFSSDQPTQKVIAATQVPAKNLELWRRLPITLLKNNGSIQQKGSLGLQVLALPANTTLYQPLIESGRWLQAGDAGQRVLVLSADTAQLNNITVGDTVQARLGASQQDWQVIGLYRWLAVSSYSVEPVYAPLATVENLSQHQDLASLALIAAPINTLSEEADYLRKLKQRFKDHGIQLDVYSTLAKLEQRQFARNQFNPVIGTLFGLAAMIACVSGIGLSGAVAISVLQRTREIGVLRAIGAPSTAIFRLFLMEGWLHVLCAWALTVPLAYLAAKPISEELGKTMLGIQLDFVFDAIAVLYWLGILLMLAFLAAYWPAKKAAQLTVKESLGH
ncbi:MAG: FtsX-like permease family protein, partial [Methylococcales bacterium]